MKTYVELKTASYWNATVEQEANALRRERTKQTAETMTTFAVLLIILFVTYFSYSRGAFDNWDVFGAFAYMRDSVAVFANNASNYFKGGSWG